MKIYSVPSIVTDFSYNNLINMDLIDSAGNLLPLGYVCNSFNKFDIKIAKMCVGGYYLGCLEYSITLGAILSVVMSIEDMFQKQTEITGQLLNSLDAQEGAKAFTEKREPKWQSK